MPVIERLLALRYGISDDAVLNTEPDGPSHAGPPEPERLGDVLLNLRAQAAATGADGLNYAAMAQSESHSAYRRYLADLRSFDPKTLVNREQRLAFWINLYNGLVLDAVVQWKVRRSVREVPGFFWRAAYDIGGLRYSANDIENGILRANRPHPAIPGAPFGRSDPRRMFSMDGIDPRIHFALVCASRSCPPIARYDAGRIDQQLDLAARAFIRGEGVQVDAVQGQVHLSRIFEWYGADFGARWQAIGDRRPLLRFIATYLHPTDAKLVLARRQWTVRFLSYNWSLNGLWAGEEADAPGRG